MSKALTLALALVAGRAQADAGGALVVSALFGTEPPSYVHAAVANVLTQTGSARQFQATRPTAWSWRRQRRRGFRPNSGRWLRCTGRAR